MFKDFVDNKSGFLAKLFPDLKEGWFVYTTSLNRSLFKRVAEVTLGEAAWKSKQVWFCPLVYRTRKSRSNANGLGSWVLWIDIDDKTKLPPLPPSILVETKNGYHAYYRLSEFTKDLKKIEALNKKLAKISGGDSCWSASHFMRVPNTWHLKDPEDPYFITVKSETDLIYDTKTIETLLTLPVQCIKYLHGDPSDDRSKSDYILMSEMLTRGIDEEVAKAVWLSSGGNTKGVERGDDYVDSVVRRATANAQTTRVQPRRMRRRRTRGAGTATSRSFFDGPSGTFMVNGNDTTHLCNFAAKVQSVIIPRETGSELLYMVVATHHDKPYTLTVTKSAFNSRRNLNAALGSTPLMWYEGDIQLAYYFEYLNEATPRKIIGVKSLGLHYHDNTPFYLFEDGLVNANLTWSSHSESHTSLYGDSTVIKGYNVVYNQNTQRGKAHRLAELLPKVNKAPISWALIGWFMSALYKPWLYREGYKFPILAFLGPAGSGKTTTISLLMQVFGNKTPQSIVADTTIFSVLANLGATTSFPMNLSEVSATTKVKKLRSLFLTLYDGARATRGRRDQTLNDYNLTTPLILDGNYLPLTDRAFIERTILIWAPSQDNRTTVEENALHEIRLLMTGESTGVFEQCIDHVLRSLTHSDCLTELQNIYRAILKYNPKASERILKNYATIAFGAIQFSKSLNIDPPTIDLFSSLIEQTRGIGYTDALTYFIEFVVNAAANNDNMDILVGDGKLGFRLNAMYNYFTQRVKALPTNLSRDGLRLSLQGAVYYKGTKRVLGLTYHTIDLKKASSLLNIPIDGINDKTQEGRKRI